MAGCRTPSCWSSSPRAPARSFAAVELAYTVRRERCPLGEVETWVFDLDNTLYPASSGLFPQVQARMNEYIGTLLGVSLEEAKELRARYFREHGTTMHGLMAVHDIDPHEFMAFVHD